MPLVILTVAIQVITVVHLLRSGRDMRWLFLIIFLPMVGCLAYLIIEVLPSLRQSPTARRALKRAQDAVDPNRGVREGSLNYERSQNIETAARLAGELTRSRPARRSHPHLHRSTHRLVRGRPEDPARSWLSAVRRGRLRRRDRDARLPAR